MTRTEKLFYERAPGQTRLGFLGPGDQLLEIWFDALHRPNLIGSVHQARIDRVFLTQNRAMASLANGEVISLRLRKHDRNLVTVGAVLPITIIAAPRHDKPWQALLGARLATSEMILLVGMPDQANSIQLSSKISSKQRKSLMARLMFEVAPLLPRGFGIILRRDGAGLSNFGAVTNSLLEMWKTGAKILAKDKLGLIFDAGDLLSRARRLVGNLPVINDPMRVYNLSTLLDDEIAAAIVAKCPLALGGHLWCEKTQAIWSIDLDGSGVSNLGRLCSEAVVEIARQIRLRGMSGPVMIDVPRLPLGQARQFRSKLREELGGNLRQPEYLGMTRGGLLELRVPHGQMALDEVMRDQPAQNALAALRLLMHRPGFHQLTLAVSKVMAEWLEGPGKPALDQLERPLRLSVWSDDAEGQIVRVLD